MENNNFRNASGETYETVQREIDQLKKERDNDKPAAVLEPTPDGDTKREVDTEIRNKREQRIKNRETVMNTRMLRDRDR